MYLCWQNDGSVLGVATSEENAQEMCSELGDSYMPVQENYAQREFIETTPICIHNTKHGFLNYKECLKKGIKFVEMRKKHN